MPLALLAEVLIHNNEKVTDFQKVNTAAAPLCVPPQKPMNFRRVNIETYAH